MNLYLSSGRYNQETKWNYSRTHCPSMKVVVSKVGLIERKRQMEHVRLKWEENPFASSISISFTSHFLER